MPSWRAPDLRDRGLDGGAFEPILSNIFAFDKIVDAFRYLEADELIGEIVVTV
jgi:hypothetical protein